MHNHPDSAAEQVNGFACPVPGCPEFKYPIWCKPRLLRYPDKPGDRDVEEYEPEEFMGTLPGQFAPRPDLPSVWKWTLKRVRQR